MLLTHYNTLEDDFAEGLPRFLRHLRHCLECNRTCFGLEMDSLRCSFYVLYLGIPYEMPMEQYWTRFSSFVKACGQNLHSNHLNFDLARLSLRFYLFHLGWLVGLHQYWYIEKAPLREWVPRSPEWLLKHGMILSMRSHWGWKMPLNCSLWSFQWAQLLEEQPCSKASSEQLHTCLHKVTSISCNKFDKSRSKILRSIGSNIVSVYWKTISLPHSQ